MHCYTQTWKDKVASYAFHRPCVFVRSLEEHSDQIIFNGSPNFFSLLIEHASYMAIGKRNMITGIAQPRRTNHVAPIAPQMAPSSLRRGNARE